MRKPLNFLLILLILLSTASTSLLAQSEGKSLYNEISKLEIGSKAVELSNEEISKDRLTMQFNGKLHFGKELQGRPRAAVFIGKGTLKVKTPDVGYEKANLKRLTGREEIETDFETVVFRYSDSSLDGLWNRAQSSNPSVRAQKLLQKHESKIAEETGMDLSSRISMAILNKEKDGFFIATFDGGKKGNFSFLLDEIARTPSANFGLNGGEKGLVFSHSKVLRSSEIWMAFYSALDYQRKTVAYSDTLDLIDAISYQMLLDLRKPGKELRLKTTLQFASRFNGINAIPFYIGESLGEFRNQRKNKQMMVEKVVFEGKEIEFSQRQWESGFVVYLPRTMSKDEKGELTIVAAGDYLREPDQTKNVYYPRSNSTWYPRHGYLDRSTFDFEFLHNKNNKIASVGTRLSEERIPDTDDFRTKYKIKNPIALTTFAVGPFERHQQEIKWDDGSPTTKLEFNSLSGAYVKLKEDFMLAELNNTVRYFQALFGRYPYETYGGTFHPFPFGQGFATMVWIPKSDTTSKYSVNFVSHETSHQWWGNIVSWRSYRDQWLSEGFAEYSGILYTSLRKKDKSYKTLIKQMRSSIKRPVRTTTGVGKESYNDIGPIILGTRLNSSKTLGAYNILVYNKGGLVLRNLHFLLSNPANGDDKLFFDMMKEFVETYRDKSASSDDFRAVANKYFAKSPIRQKYRLTNLNWFFAQYVYRTNLPSYKVKYEITETSKGEHVVRGTIEQEDVDSKWFTVVPIRIKFGGKQVANGTIHAFGEKTQFSLKFPVKPKGLEIDPDEWILFKDRSVKLIRGKR